MNTDCSCKFSYELIMAVMFLFYCDAMDWRFRYVDIVVGSTGCGVVVVAPMASAVAVILVLILVCLMMLSVIWDKESIVIGGQWRKNWKDCARKWSWTNLKYCPCIHKHSLPTSAHYLLLLHVCIYWTVAGKTCNIKFLKLLPWYFHIGI